MDNNTKHDNLEGSEIRDLLAKLVGYGYDGEVEIIESRIKDLQVELEAAKESEAARTLIRLKGWKEHDVSDIVQPYIQLEYFPFVGTDEELKLVAN